MLTQTASKLGCILFAGLLIAATPVAGPNPMSRFDILTGSFNCTSTSGKPYVESFTRPMTANWIRATDIANDGTFAGEHTLGYNGSSKTWSIVSIYSDGTVSVDRTGSVDSTAMEGPMTTVYPPNMSARLTFTRLSATSYAVEGRGSYKGDPFHFRDTCTKRA